MEGFEGFTGDFKKYYYWESLETSIIHSGYRVIAEYKVEVDFERGGFMSYTGQSRMRYEALVH